MGLVVEVRKDTAIGVEGKDDPEEKKGECLSQNSK